MNSSSVGIKKCYVRVTRLRINKPELDVDRIAKECASENLKISSPKLKGTTAEAPESEKLKLESPHEQLVIISVKEHNGQIMIEFQAQSSTSVSTIPEIKVYDEIEIGETSLSVQSIHTADGESDSNQAIMDALTEIEEMDFELQEAASGTSEITIADKPDVSEENKHQDELICDICSMEYSTKAGLDKHRLGHDEKTLNCIFGGVAKFIQQEEKVEKSIYFTCDICSKKYASKTNLVAHLKIHDPNAIFFTCNICSKGFSTKARLNAHRLRHDEKKFNCNVCGLAQFSQHDMDVHMKTHDTKPMYYKCHKCPKKYLNEDELRVHQKRHSKKKFMCPDCGVAKITQSELNSHMEVHNTARDQLKCPQCAQWFLHQKSLDLHVSVTHNDELPFPCDECKDCFATKYRLVQHMRKHASVASSATNHQKLRKPHLKKHEKRQGKPKFHCTVCGLTKLTQDDMDMHMKKHDTTPIHFECDICLKKYSSEDNLRVHKKRHIEKNFICQYCGVAKITQRELNSHMEVHNTARDQLKCPQCAQWFLHQKSLDLHVSVTHNDELPFACDQCTDCFATKYRLVQHMQKHTSAVSSATNRQTKKR